MNRCHRCQDHPKRPGSGAEVEYHLSSRAPQQKWNTTAAVEYHRGSRVPQQKWNTTSVAWYHRGPVEYHMQSSDTVSGNI